MNTKDTPFTITTLLAAADEILGASGFGTVDPATTGTWAATEARVYEDAHSIVCVAAYETWSALSSTWHDDQANLVELISRHFTRSEAKAWDGYLVILTPSFVPASERQEAVNIQRNTVHVRKLLATGDELETVDAVRRTLLPLLPLEIQEASRPSNVLHSLPPLLSRYGVDEEISRVAIAAFLEQRPIIEAIHELVEKDKDAGSEN